MKPLDCIILGLVAAAVFLAVVYMRKRKKKGCNGCCSCCQKNCNK